MILYKDKECKIEAICPITFPSIENRLNHFGTFCRTNCAWSVYRENENAYSCGVLNACQLMYAKEPE